MSTTNDTENKEKNSTTPTEELAEDAKRQLQQALSNVDPESQELARAAKLVKEMDFRTVTPEIKSTIGVNVVDREVHFDTNTIDEDELLNSFGDVAQFATMLAVEAVLEGELDYESLDTDCEAVRDVYKSIVREMIVNELIIADGFSEIDRDYRSLLAETGHEIARSIDFEDKSEPEEEARLERVGEPERVKTRTVFRDAHVLLDDLKERYDEQERIEGEFPEPLKNALKTLVEQHADEVLAKLSNQ